MFMVFVYFCCLDALVAEVPDTYFVKRPEMT